MNSSPTDSTRPISAPAARRAAILLAKASITGAASSEMQQTASRAQLAGGYMQVLHAFSEQGSPNLREALDQLRDAGVDEIVIAPCLLPMEPGFKTWIAGAVQRWRRESAADGRHVPVISLAMPEAAHVDALVQGMLGSSASPVAAGPGASAAAGSVIPPQKRRVLVCQGAPCNNAGAGLVWGHLRSEQKRLDLRTTGDGMMSARTSCLGPCHLGPVVQVFPEATWYGGVDEAGVDRIIVSHLLQGQVVEALAYPLLPGKQTLR